jgi:hypothetical protein
VIAGRVKDAEDYDGVAFDVVEELVGKAPGQDPPESSVVEWKALGRLFQAGERVCHAEKELAAQAGGLALIPLLRLAEVGHGGGADGDAPGHRGGED